MDGSDNMHQRRWPESGQVPDPGFPLRSTDGSDAWREPMAEYVRTFDARAADKLLTRGNTLAGVTAAVLDLLAADRDIPADELRGYSRDLRAWAADVRAVASEQRP